MVVLRAGYGHTIVASHAIDASGLALAVTVLVLQHGLTRRSARERFLRVTRRMGLRAMDGFSLGDFEAGLAEKPDHVVAKFADRVLAHGGHQQMVHQRAAEHVGERF